VPFKTLKLFSHLFNLSSKLQGSASTIYWCSMSLIVRPQPRISTSSKSEYFELRKTPTISRVSSCNCTGISVAETSQFNKVKAKAVPLHATKALGGKEYSSYSFSSSTLDGGEWSASRPGRALDPGKGPPGTHWTGGWAGPRAGLDTEARGKILSPLPGIESRSSGRPARSPALY
jgi:hypothetical protein